MDKLTGEAASGVHRVTTEANGAPEAISRFIERRGAAGVRHIPLSRDFPAAARSPRVSDAVLDLARRARAEGHGHFPAARRLSQGRDRRRDQDGLRRGNGRTRPESAPNRKEARS